MNENLIVGRCRKFGEDINTDVISPGQYLSCSREVIAEHVLEGVYPNFSKTVLPNDIIVAGRNFGSGSSRETAALALKDCGISAVIAPSFARIFYRNSINIGLPVLICESCDEICEGDILAVSPMIGRIHNNTQDKVYTCQTLPEHIIQILNNGGLLNVLKQTLQMEDEL